MARKITHTLILEGSLVAQTPLHTGGADTWHTTDMPLAVNGRGEFYLSGTSIAGAIHAWEQAEEGNVIWGYAKDKTDEGNASFIIVDDAPAKDAPIAEIWHGIGIDRKWGGAANGIKFDRQALPQGTRFCFRLQREVGKVEELEEARKRVGQLAMALEAGDIPFGGGVTRGFGRLKLEGATGSETDWSGKAGILSWLADEPRDNVLAEWRKLGCTSTDKRARTIEIEIHWQPQGPLMSKAARDGMAVDALPFVSRNRHGKYALTLPGSGIKGALRQHAERIVRTVLGSDGKADAEQHFDQVNVPLVRDLFGAARPADNKDKKPVEAAKGKLAVDTCYAGFALARNDWDSLDVSVAAWQGTQPLLTRADHVAIDRWTGGAADTALFNAVEPDKSIQWEPIRMTLDCRRGKPLPELALLWLTLRDFCAGRIPLGFGVNRGYGDLAVNKISLRGLDALGCEEISADLMVTEGRIEENDITKMRDTLKNAWAAWIKSQETGGNQ